MSEDQTQHKAARYSDAEIEAADEEAIKIVVAGIAQIRKITGIGDMQAAMSIQTALVRLILTGHCVGCVNKLLTVIRDSTEAAIEVLPHSEHNHDHREATLQ